MLGTSGVTVVAEPQWRRERLGRGAWTVPWSPTGTVGRPARPTWPRRRPQLAVSTGVELLAQGAQVLLEAGVLTAELGDLLVGVQHGGVVLAAEGLADGREAGGGLLSDEEHGHLSGEDYVLVPTAALHLLQGDVVVGGDRLLDVLDAHRAGVAAGDDVAEDPLSRVEGDRLAVERGVGQDADERALELADVLLDLVGDEGADLVGDQP